MQRNVDLTQLPLTAAYKTVRLTSVHHNGIARPGDHLLFANCPCRLTLDDIDDFIVIVCMETNAAPRFTGAHQKKRDARRALLFPTNSYDIPTKGSMD
ncbi:MAG: hypothetical protein QOK38_1328 [Acidobacteriaceae bacterium]|nr:hypothetical protein [Acidobacteriaceae bacterium]